jgi:hypothetical protein
VVRNLRTAPSFHNALVILPGREVDRDERDRAAGSACGELCGSDCVRAQARVRLGGELRPELGDVGSDAREL